MSLTVKIERKKGGVAARPRPAAPGQRQHLREINGNLTRDSGGNVTAWYRLPPVRWSLQTAEQRTSTITELAVAYAALAGHQMHLRVTQRPHPSAQWAKDFLDRTWTQEHEYARLEAANPDALVRYAVRVQEFVSRSMNIMDQETYLGVQIGKPGSLHRLASLARRDPEAKRLRAALKRNLDEVTAKVTDSALRGQPATSADLQWLQHKSIGLGLPEARSLSDGTLGGDDLFVFTDGVGVDPNPGGSWIRLTARASRANGAAVGSLTRRKVADLRDGSRILLDVDGSQVPVMIREVSDGAVGFKGTRKVSWQTADGRVKTSDFAVDAEVTIAPVERYVAVLTLGRMEDQEIPGRHAPWLAVAQRLPFPVEISAHVQALDGQVAQKQIGNLLNLIMDQNAQQQQFGDRVDREMLRVVDEAGEVLDRVQYGSSTESVEFQGVYRLAVSGSSPEEVLDRAARLTRIYLDQGISLEHPEAQHALAGEFDLGAKRATRAYMRYQFADMFAAAVPQLGAKVGDHCGIFIGYTVGTVMQPVFWDPFRALYEGEGSGLTPVVAGLGGGKSVFAGMIAFYGALMGAQTTILDPSGPLARLCYHPAIVDDAYHLDLREAAPGTLCPFTVVAEPNRAYYESVEEWEAARSNARTHRRALAMDVALMLLDKSTRDDPRTRRVLRRAMTTIRGLHTESMVNVINALKMLDPNDNEATDVTWARTLAMSISDMQSAPYAPLVFGAGYTTDVDFLRKRLLVITMAGLLPADEGSDENTWTEEQRMAQPLMYLASFLTTRRIYDAPMSSSKLIVLDEAHWLERWPTGRGLLQTLRRDSRKRRTRVLVPTQNPGDILSAQGADNLINESFVGRIESALEADKALGLQDVQASPAHRAILASLSARVGGKQPNWREFSFHDGESTEIIRVPSMEHLDPILAAALDPEDDRMHQFLPSHLRQRSLTNRVRSSVDLLEVGA